MKGAKQIKMKTTLLLASLLITFSGFTQFAPPVGEVGTTAVSKDSSAIIDWAVAVESFTRGPEDIEVPDGTLASYGEPSEALNVAEGTSVDVVSLGDGGSITLTFNYSIRNDDGADFAVFENSFSDNYLELAHVEVSSDGVRFVRIPSISNTPTEEQVGTYESIDPSMIYNLAGKYRQGYGTPFDLEDIADSSGIDLMDVKYVRIVDVVGTINPEFGTTDSEGNLINDPYKTDFESGGFDLDAVGVMHNNDPSLSLQKNEGNALSVYPNPTRGLINVDFEGELQSLVIYDEVGRIVFQSFDESPDLMNVKLNSGFYFLIATDHSDKIHQEKITVID